MTTTQIVNINQLQILLDKLQIAFKPIIIDPTKTHDEIMFDGGKQKVINYIAEYIKTCQRKSDISV